MKLFIYVIKYVGLPVAKDKPTYTYFTRPLNPPYDKFVYPHRTYSTEQLGLRKLTSGYYFKANRGKSITSKRTEQKTFSISQRRQKWCTFLSAALVQNLNKRDTFFVKAGKQWRYTIISKSPACGRFMFCLAVSACKRMRGANKLIAFLVIVCMNVKVVSLF